MYLPYFNSLRLVRWLLSCLILSAPLICYRDASAVRFGVVPSEFGLVKNQSPNELAYNLKVPSVIMPSPVEMAPQDPRKSYKVISSETHERVLDIVFQLDEVDLNYDFVLRFEPSFAAESQIVIKSPGGKTSVIEYTSLSGNIYRKLNSMMANGGKEDVVEMAKLIEVRKRVVDVPAAQAALWHTSLADSIGATVKVLEERSDEAARGIGTLTIDGTFYSLWWDQDGSHISTSVWDHEVSNREVTGELKLVQWMNTLRREVATLPSKKDSVNQAATTKRPK